ncbi:T9SS type A sorting domain-containing protein [Rasiella rasia]|uniref:T9SS type A sorting domain-containing protein n=1 Tax=Rasiella rasia TaxID=2744027 RepID=A0A6G6GQ92_9FLAO|nr:T9SS type A sorting domain-containing protein [Rasiella rasia]QIE60719.1 T9SS type A sorting domain-containing protein [Rasiella rasia]
MKKITILIALLACTLGFAQESVRETSRITIEDVPTERLANLPMYHNAFTPLPGDTPEGGDIWTVTVSVPGFGDEVSWELRDDLGVAILSGGPIATGGSETLMVNTSSSPLEFFIESIGTFNDNTPTWEVSCSGVVATTGTLAGGTDATESGLVCGVGLPPVCGGENLTNAFENAFFSSPGTFPDQVIAGDLTVPADSDFTLDTMLTEIWVNPGQTILSVDITIYGDAAGSPDTGNVITTFAGLAPDSQTNVGSNFGFDIYDVSFDMGGLSLSGQPGTTTEYWVSMYIFASDNNDAGWGATSVSSVANNLHFSLDGGVTWTLDTVNDVVATYIGTCANNDECSGAIAMSCGDVETGDTSTNTDTGGFNDSPDAWYSYTGSGDPEFVTFSLCDGGTAYDSRLTVYDVCGGVEIALNDDACGLQSEVSFLSDGTTTYFVAVEGFGTGDAGAFSLEVSCNPVAANDLCDDAIAVSCGDVISGSTNFATIDDAVAGNCDDTFDPTPFLPTVEVVSPGVWYSYTEPIPGFVQDITLDLCDAADFDTKISVYSGDCGALVCVAANDDNDDCTGFTSTVEFQSDGISTYYILVHGFNQTGNFDLSVNCAPVPPPNDMIVNSIDVDEIGFPYTDPAVNMPGATVEAGGTPADCDNAGVRGVWYNFVPEMGGTATASVTTPAAYTSVTFYTAPDEDSVETDLVLVDYFDNQCVPGADASILVTAGQPYYVYVANQGGVTDIVIDGDFYLGIGDTEIQGFSYFPNPAENQLNLRSGGGTIESAIIYNILGQEVLSERVGSSDAQLNVANLSVGTYILKVVVDGELGIYKIVKQ